MTEPERGGRELDHGEQLAWVEGVLRGVELNVRGQSSAETLRELADTAERWRASVRRGPTLRQVRNMIEATARTTGDDWRAELWHALGYLDELVGDDKPDSVPSSQAAAYEAGRARAESAERKGEG